jgi:hypothetical protein
MGEFKITDEEGVFLSMKIFLEDKLWVKQDTI